MVLPGYDIRLWKHEKSQSFHDNFNLDSLREIDSKLSFLTKRGSLQQEEIDEIVMQIGQNFERCAEASFGRVKRPSVKHENDTANKPWFNVNCKRARNDYHKARRKYNANKSEQNKQILRQTSKFYKNTMNLSVKQFKNVRIQKLKNLKTTNPREYWKILNSSNPKSTCQAPLDELYNYFKEVNDYSDHDTTHVSFSQNENNDRINARLNRPFSEAEVRVAISQLKLNKSAGLDNIKKKTSISNLHRV